MRESPSQQRDIQITKYASRHWAVWLSGELVAVTVYLKGATRVAELLRGLPEKLALPTPDTVLEETSEQTSTTAFALK